MIQLSIKEMETLSTVRADTLRVWEKRYFLFSPARKNNIRIYSITDLRKLLLVSFLHRNGRKLPNLSVLSLSELTKIKDASICTTEDHQDWLINEFILLMYENDPVGFEMVLEKGIRMFTLPVLIEKVISPFLYRTQLFWTGKLLTQEHFIVTFVRKKLMVAIDQVIPEVSTDRVVLLYLLTGKQLDLGLLYANYILKKSGWRVMNVGTDISPENLADYFAMLSPDILFTYSSFQSEKDAADICNSLSDLLPAARIITAIYPRHKFPVYRHGNMRHLNYDTVLQSLGSHSHI